MTDTPKQEANVISLAAARRNKSVSDKPRHVRKQEARAEKAKQAEANRVRSGRTKLERAQDRAASEKVKKLVDGSRLDGEKES